jgi:NAD(P)-dependent dehydrogenase (short-subunit alcohol dehydrogenase family)
MRSLIIGASGGIGAALLQACAAHGEALGLSRSKDGLEITDEASVVKVLSHPSGDFDRILIATGALAPKGARPEKSLRALEPAQLLQQVATNALGPALLLKHLLPLIPRARPCQFGVLSARVGSIGDNALGGWYSYRAAKAALNQLVHTAAIEVARSHPQAVLACLHPGTVETRFTEGYSAKKTMPEQAAAQLLKVLAALTPAQSGGFYDWAGKQLPW